MWIGVVKERRHTKDRNVRANQRHLAIDQLLAFRDVEKNTWATREYNKGAIPAPQRPEQLLELQRYIQPLEGRYSCTHFPHIVLERLNSHLCTAP